MSDHKDLPYLHLGRYQLKDNLVILMSSLFGVKGSSKNLSKVLKWKLIAKGWGA